jgi:hypothetical protein
MPSTFSQAELDAYLDEALPAEEMARIERALRSDKHLLASLAEVVARRNAGVHSVGAIWRRHRLSCPTREQLGSFLLGALPEPVAEYIQFHLELVGCRYCRANLTDLQRCQSEPSETVHSRRRRYFQSSAGHLRRRA